MTIISKYFFNKETTRVSSSERENLGDQELPRLSVGQALLKPDVSSVNLERDSTCHRDFGLSTVQHRRSACPSCSLKMVVLSNLLEN